MERTRRHICRALLLGLPAAALPAGRAHAYLLPAKHVLRKAGRAMQPAARLDVTLRGRARLADQTVKIAERWVLDRAASRIQMSVNAGGGRNAAWSSDGRSQGDPALLPTDAERTIIRRLYIDTDLSRLADELGVDTNVQSLARIGRRIAHVVGAGPRDPRAPRLIVDQEDFRLLGAAYPTGSGSWVQVELSDWSGPPGNGVFPQRINVSLDRRWLRRIELDTVTLNTAGG
jgi:hypothetical protein